MEDKEKCNKGEEEKKSEECVKIGTKNEKNEDAGPSGTITLPGTVTNPKITVLKPGISKSDYCIRHVITTNDVTNALKSISFGTTIQKNKNILLKDLNLPILNDDIPTEKNEDNSTTLIDLKKFMASCFKPNREPETDMILSEMPNRLHQNQAIVQSVTNVIVETPNASCVTNTIQTEEEVPIKPNEVIVTKVKPVPEKKKLPERSDLCVTQRDSLSSIGSNVCRICMTRGRERLISPCNCKGSLANVHLTCLERWLNQVGRNHCELCGFSYPAIRTPRYTVLQALRLWFGNPRNRSHLQSDCLIFWLLSTVTAGLLAVCIVGTQYFVIEGSNFGISHRITETAMDFFMAIVLCGYSVTVYLLWKDHYVMWNRWRRANVNVRLLLSPDSNPVPFMPRSRYNVV